MINKKESFILVTGAAGFIGSALVKKLLTHGYKVLGIDNLNDYYDLSLKKSVTYFLEHAYKNKNFPKECFKKSLASNNFII